MPVTESDSSDQQAAGSWAEVCKGQYAIYTLVLCLGMLLFAINQFVVATVMPSVVADLGGVSYYTWVFSLFAVGAVVGAASAGQLREAFGVRGAYAGAGLRRGLCQSRAVAWRVLESVRAGGSIAERDVVAPRDLASGYVGNRLGLSCRDCHRV